MPRFFFHLVGDPLEDRVGLDLPGLKAAQVEAVRHLQERLRAHRLSTAPRRVRRVEVTDAGGELLFSKSKPVEPD